MFRFFLVILFLLILYYVVRFLIRDILSTRQKPEHEELVEDPSCKIYVPKSSALKKKIRGRQYYFCSRECLKKFLKSQ